MWYLTVKRTTDARTMLSSFPSSEDASAEKARILAEEDPEAEISDPFEESAEYYNSWPRVQGYRVVGLDGTEVDMWDDGVETPRS
jgi:hypothetical protein